MSKSKHGASICVNVYDDNLEGALKRYLKLSGSVIAEYKKATDCYIKPSSLRHQEKQTLIHNLKLERKGCLQ
jgi:hypothetical protein